MQRHTPVLFCDSWPWPLTYWPQNIYGFQDSSWNIWMSSFVILAASYFEISCGKRRDRQTDKRRWKPYPATAVGVGEREHYCYGYIEKIGDHNTRMRPTDNNSQATQQHWLLLWAEVVEVRGRIAASDVINAAASAWDAVNHQLGQRSQGIPGGEDLLCSCRKVGLRRDSGMQVPTPADDSLLLTDCTYYEYFQIAPVLI